MGFLLDLLRRWFGVPRTLEAPPGPVADADAGPEDQPPAEAEPPAAVAAEPPAPPRPAALAPAGLPWLAAPPESPAEADPPEPPLDFEAAAPVEAEPPAVVIPVPPEPVEAPAFAASGPTPIAESAAEIEPEVPGPSAAEPPVEVEAPTDRDAPTAPEVEPPVEAEPVVEVLDDAGTLDLADAPEVDSPTGATPEADLAPAPPVEADVSPPEPTEPTPPESSVIPPDDRDVESPSGAEAAPPTASLDPEPEPEPEPKPEPGPVVPSEVEAAEPPDLPTAELPVEAAPSISFEPEPAVEVPAEAEPLVEVEPSAPLAPDGPAESPDAIAAEPSPEEALPIELPMPADVEASEPLTEVEDEASPAIVFEPLAALAPVAEVEEADSAEPDGPVEVAGSVVAEEESPTARIDVDRIAGPASGEEPSVEQDQDFAAPEEAPMFDAVEPPTEGDPDEPSAVAPPAGPEWPIEPGPPAEVEVAASPADEAIDEPSGWAEEAVEVEDEAEPTAESFVAGDLPMEAPAEVDRDDAAAAAETPAETPPPAEVEAGPSSESIDAEPEAVRPPETPAELDLFAGGSPPVEVNSDEAAPAELESPIEPETPAADAPPADRIADGVEAPGAVAAEPSEAVAPAEVEPDPALDLAPSAAMEWPLPVEAARDQDASPAPVEGLTEVDLVADGAPEIEAEAPGDESASPVDAEPEAPAVAGPPDEAPAEVEPPAWVFEPEPQLEAGFLPPFEVADPVPLNVEAPPEPSAEVEAAVPIEPEGSVAPDLPAEPSAEAESAAEPAIEPDPIAAWVSPVEVEEGITPPRAAPLGLAGDLEAPLWGGGGPDLSVPAEAPEARAERRAAAARTREDRRAAAAERRATDIIYLGRGVSEALHDRAGDHARLDDLGLPHLDSPADLAGRLGISVGRLRWLAFHAEVASRVHYVGFEVAKRGGGVRHLSAPHRSLAEAQRWIFEEVVARLPVEAEAHGFVPGRSIVTNARPHSGRAVVVNLDLEGFFPGIGFRRVRAVFERAGYSPALATILGLLCTEAPRRAVTHDGATLHVATGPRALPQGACTSPGLSNQVARRLDRRLAGLAASLGATYTRYADDLTFSGDAPLDPKVGHLLAQARRIAASEGFRVNEAKTRVQRPNTAQTVTGLVVNDRPGVARAEVRRLRAILHRARLEGLDAQNHGGHPNFRAYLEGMIAFVAMARPEAGARLREEYRALDSV